jgi:hypothetical protein
MPSRTRPDLALAFDVVSPKIAHAARVASKQLEDLGLNHALIGGLAVGAHGAPRATKDVDFLVDDDAFEHHAEHIVTFRSGVPIAVGEVPIDLLLADTTTLTAAISSSRRSEGIPVVDIEVLVLLKLRAMRLRDRADVLALLNAGANPRALRAYLQRHEPSLLDHLQEVLIG